LRRGEIYSDYHGLMKAIVDQGHLVVEKKLTLKGRKHIAFHGVNAYEPPAFGVRPLERVEVRKYSERGETGGLAGEANRLLEAVKRYRQAATLPTPWMERMEANLNLIQKSMSAGLREPMPPSGLKGKETKRTLDLLRTRSRARR